MLETYLRHIAQLKTDRSANRWTDLTMNKAPHKAFTLLAVMDLFAIAAIEKNFIPPATDLVDNFNCYWELVMPHNKKSSMAYPFPRLANDGIWQLVANPDHIGKINIESISSMKKLRQVCAGAVMPDDLYSFMCDPTAREALRVEILKNYFAPEIQSLIKEQGVINQQSFGYSLNILGRTDQVIMFDPENEYIPKKVRNQGFRKAIVSLYDHRCAMCGIRLLTPEGHTIVEAAHIIPWRETKDDSPINGMALCKVCHWSFDEGLMAVDQNYKVLVSGRIQKDKNYPGHMSTLMDRQIIMPEEERYFPGLQNLEQHRNQRFS
ncbi:MAG: HNH endonuclease [Deltaproteobacteria bacterium]|jgi:putative restriction endonuclease|nr:HNH endonuclease [Deltaproteobacteria bacterium]MBT4090199.1 HNH endonuclease [Deltaproteobacteria bacterium]MBT4268323.1 HNH endonuclease [Deltaproteobacteria bacterium]MBT4642306.1 HNH endonuclease [Deltaproteobacteria bacterium]MBT6498960.1 HNH endonuclease [Deltaproteobacteria bacterium]